MVLVVICLSINHLRAQSLKGISENEQINMFLFPFVVAIQTIWHDLTNRSDDFCCILLVVPLFYPFLSCPVVFLFSC